MEQKKPKFDIKNILQFFLGLLGKIQRRIKPIFFVAVGLIYIFIIFRINVISSAAPTQEEIDTHLAEVKKPRIDKNAVKVLNQLEDQNIQVQTLFQEARNNPFAE